MENIAIIVLAAGKGTRMKQDLPKVLSQTYQTTLIDHVLSALAPLKPETCLVVTGHHRELVEAEVLSNTKNYSFKNLDFAEQAEQLGTGHAVKMALPKLANFRGQVLIAYGDMPLITTETFKQFISFHLENRNTLSLLSLNNNHNHYGRIIRDEAGKPLKIVEYKDCTALQRATKETNTGVYLVDSAFLSPAINELENNNKQKEYYLTDIFERATKEGQNVDCLMIDDALECQGVNDLFDLKQINHVLRQRKIKDLIVSGVNFILPESSYIDYQVNIEIGAEIGPNCQIFGKTTIGSGTKIEGNSWIKNCQIGNDNLIKISCRLENAEIADHCEIGPFAHLRPESKIGSNAKVGNFVETKKTILGNGAKASHLTYLGDCLVGENANIGAGTITCNYDGKNKFQTKIGAEAFIGSNSSLVAPVEIGANALIGAGSVITKNIPDRALGLTRAELKIKENYRKS